MRDTIFSALNVFVLCGFTLGAFVAFQSKPVWSQSPTASLQQGTYNAPSGTGASTPNNPAGMQVPIPRSQPFSQPSSVFNQDILNPNFGTGSPQLRPDNPVTVQTVPRSDLIKRTIIRVKVPEADARLWVNDQLTKQSGLERVFVTPELDAGSYRYRFRLSGLKNEISPSIRQTVIFEPGTEVILDFHAKHRPTP